MSVQRLRSRDLLFPLLLCVSALALFASIAQAEDRPSRLGLSWGVERIHSEAREGDTVTLEGRVVSISRSRFFTLQDAAGDQIVTDIPNHLMRDTGKPKSGETIRVRGKYDHKTHLDVDKSKKADTRKNWGIRVSAIDRNVSTSGRNTGAPEHVTPSSTTGEKAAPAAPMGSALGTVGTPNTPAELKARLTAARKHVLATQKKLDDSKADFARGEYRKVEGAERDALSANQKRAQQEYDEAVAVISPLVEEAREAGVDPKVLELYEAGITKPQR